MKIGILGGSFDPPHKGHIHISIEALKRLNLDQIWWLVSPQNPLKARRPQDISMRAESCRQLIHHPKILVKTLELHLKTNKTVETLSAVKTQFPYHRFVWLMGADNLATFHKWYRWTDIIEQNYIAVFPRKGFNSGVNNSVSAQRYAKFRLQSDRSHELLSSDIPRWVFLRHSMINISSTAIRQKQGANVK